jgi:hypothetical protein
VRRRGIRIFFRSAAPVGFVLILPAGAAAGSPLLWSSRAARPGVDCSSSSPAVSPSRSRATGPEPSARFPCARFSVWRRPSRCLLPISTAVVILLFVCKDSSSTCFVDSVFTGAKIRSALACFSARRRGSLGSTRRAPPQAGLVEVALGLGLLSTPTTEPPSSEIFPSRIRFSPHSRFVWFRFYLLLLIAIASARRCSASSDCSQPACKLTQGSQEYSC